MFFFMSTFTSPVVLTFSSQFSVSSCNLIYEVIMTTMQELSGGSGGNIWHTILSWDDWQRFCTIRFSARRWISQSLSPIYAIKNGFVTAYLLLGPSWAISKGPVASALNVSIECRGMSWDALGLGTLLGAGVCFQFWLWRVRVIFEQGQTHVTPFGFSELVWKPDVTKIWTDSRTQSKCHWIEFIPKLRLTKCQSNPYYWNVNK